MSAIVRLNSKEYDRQDFVRSGFNHHDLFFEDCTTPNEQIVKVCVCCVIRLICGLAHTLYVCTHVCVCVCV